MTILEALADPNLFGAAFRDSASWRPWHAALAATFGLPMTSAQAAFYSTCTKRTTPRTTPAREAWFAVGRRGGKSRIAAAIAVYVACFRSYRDVLAPGERGTVALIAADRAQARTLFRYVGGLLDGSPMLAQLIERRTADAIDLTNGVTIEVRTASFRTLRGYTIAAAILDEVAFWRSDDSVNPDSEILDALRPAMATVPDALLVAISSPYARRGVLWEAYRKHFGQDSDVLVWQAPTGTMNPRVSADIIARAYADDAAAAAAEYGAEFRTDLEVFVPREVVEACTVRGRHVVPPRAGGQYVAFVDPSGGSADSFTLAIAHRENERIVLDVVCERKAPFNPSDVVAEYAGLCAQYGVLRVTGDRYAGEWPREAFRAHDVAYDAAERPKSDLYRDLLPVLTSGKVELIDNGRLLAQMCALERRTGRSGRDSIDHPPGGHDDVANAVAGAVATCGVPTAGFLFDEEPVVNAAARGNWVEQVKEAMPEKFFVFGQPTVAGEEPLTCGICANFERRTGRCGARIFFVTPELPACEFYDPLPDASRPA